MILTLISIVLTMLTFGAFSVSFQVNNINRCVICFPISVLEKSTRIDAATKIPYLSREETIYNITYYYDSEISKYSTDYDLEFYFYDATNNSYCVTNKCNAVQVTINAELMYSYKYERIMYYKITGVNNG